MRPSSSRRSTVLGPLVRLIASLVLALLVSACVANSPTSSAVKQAALPASAKIVRTADLTFPPATLPTSKKPDANQRAVAFLDGTTGFLARGGQPFAANSGVTPLP